jgi:peptidoglycan/LPS O-acetylase OafA/YrhL
MASLIDSKLLIIYNTAGISSDIIIGLSFSLFLIYIKGKSIKYGKKHLSVVSKWLSEVSYSLYLFHFPLVLLIYGICYKDKKVSLDFSGALQYLLWFILLLLISYIMWWFF